MALAPADFYAYSRATGTPYPEDPEERAEMAPAVAEFRRNQLKAPQQESNLLATIGAAALGLGALAGGAYGAKRLFKAPQEVREAGRKITDLPSAEAAFQTAGRYKPADTTPPPSKTAIPQATVDIPQQIIDKYADDYAKTQEKIELARQRNIVRQMDKEDVQYEKMGRGILQDLNKERQAASEVDVDKFLEENEGLYRRLVNAEDVKEKRVLGEQYLGTLQTQAREQPGVLGPHTTLPTRANQPGSFTDLTSLQENLLDQARSQQVNAVESGEDQVAQRAQRKTMSLRRSGQTETSPALQKLYESDLDNFEINARINAFAQYGKSEFLDPDYNSTTVGAQNFARTLDVVSPEFDRAGRLVGGEYAAGSRTVQTVAGTQLKRSAGPALPSESVTLPEGEIKRSAFASQQPNPVRTRSQDDEEKWEPISEALTGLTGGVSTASVPMMLSEQHEQAVNNFRQHWDEQVQQHLGGVDTAITRPARRNRLVDSFDLDLPVRLQNVEGLNEAGKLVAKTEAILYRDVLPADTVTAIERGEQMNLDVPFLVDKNRAIAVAEANPTIENRLDAEHYKRTGRALRRAHSEIVGPYANDKYIAETTQPGYFQRAENLEGKPDVTPGFGSGSQKGRLVGGTAEAPVRVPVYNLRYEPHTTAAGKQMLVNKTTIIGSNNNLEDVGISTLKQLNEIGVAKDSTGAELYVSPGQQIDFITTQPMAVKRPLNSNAQPVGTVTRKGKYGEFTNDVYEAAETIVDAPLQVLDTKTGKAVSSVSQVKRSELVDVLDGIRNFTGVKDYAELGALANRYLAGEKGITLPVLESPTAFEFIEGVIGRPGSRQSRKSFVTVNPKTGDVYPLSREEAQSLGFAGGSVVEPSLGRKYVGPPSLDIRESSKSEESWARMGEADVDWEQAKDFGDESLGSANLGGLSPRATGELQRKMSPATTGLGAELQSVREELAKIKATEPKFSTAPLPSNLEAVTQQLIAQAGRRAGKRRNR